MFSFLRSTSRATQSHRKVNLTQRLKKAWLKIDRLEQRDVPATFTVTNLNDGFVTGPNQLPGSLRQAIFDANTLPGADVIQFQVGVTGTLTINAGEFHVSDSVSITGPGAGLLTIDAGQVSRHFYVSNDAVTQIDVTLAKMTLTNGQAQTPPNPNPMFLSGSGGSIYGRNERLVLDSMVIKNSSSALNYDGGAIHMGDRPVPDQFNGSSGQGSSLVVFNSVIDNNVAPGLGGSGGGIYFQFPNSGTNFTNPVGNTLVIVNSTVSNNVAGKRAGGIYFSGGNDVRSSFTMTNTTVSGNKSLFEFSGGVQINSTTGVPMSIRNSTITNNTAMTTPGGGGLALNTGTGTLVLENSIIAGNFGTPNAPDLLSNSGVTIDARNNIIGSLTGLNAQTIFNNLGGNVFGSAKLGPLTDNGGSTLTQLPAYNSPALNPVSAPLTTLSAAATAGATTIKVSSALSLSNGAFYTLAGELVQITAINSSTITLAAPLVAGVANGTGLVSVSVVQTNLGPAITAVDTNAFVVSTIGIAPGMSLTIDSEIVRVTEVKTAAATTLIAPISEFGTIATVASTANLPIGANLRIDSEIVRVTAVTNIATTLSAAITSTLTTTFSVASGTGIVAGMYLLIDSEYVLVTAVSGTTITCIRGVNGTTAATHANGAAVTTAAMTITRGQLATTGAVHNAGATVFAPSLTLVRGQNSTTAAAHSGGRALMVAFDQIGNPRVQGATIDFGSVEVNPATPAAIATVSNITVAGGATGTFTVTFTDDTAINVASIKNNNNAIRVVGDGFDVPATYVSMDDDTTNGSPRTATYTFAAPGTWDYTDNGTYSIVVQPNQVFDTGATAVPSAAVGRFQVAIGRNLVVTSPADSGPGSLRDAIDQANMNEFVVDTITFDTVAMGGNTVFVSFSTITITDPVAINGPGITVEAGGLVRPFSSFGPGNMAISFTGMTIANGKVPGIIGDPNIGGAILGDDDQWTLTDCVLTGNTGGAIALYSVITWGAISLINTTVENNTGGGVISATSPFGPGHDVKITNSSILNNTGSGFSGRTFSFNMANSTIANNTGALRGGGINIVGNFNSNGNSIINSTITGNSVTNSGAGIYMYWFPASNQRVLIANTTVVGNKSSGGALNEGGGGVNNRATTNYLVDFENTVIASNTNSTVPDLASKSTVIANNSFIGIHQPVSAPLIGVNNKLGTKLAPLDPLLGPLANNGGPTLTRLPFSGSPLVDYSNVTPVLSTLTANLTDSATSATVASTAGFVVGMYVQIDSEIMRITAIPDATTLAFGNFIASFRGQLGTTAAFHSAGAVVTIAYTQPSTDQRGAGFPRAANGKVDIGAVEVDPNIPAAKLTSPIPLINMAGQTPVVITITYSDNVAIDVSTVKNNNNAVVITDPQGMTFNATYVSMDNDTTNGTPRTATYHFNAPGGSWDIFENGFYTISIGAMQVADTSGNFVQNHAVGKFQVGLPQTLVVVNDNDSGPGSLRNAIELANQNAGVPETITFDSSYFSTPRTIAMFLGELYISDQVTIVGPGAKFLTLQGAGSRIFTIDVLENNQVPISISGLTMTGGNGASTVDVGVTSGGGAVFIHDEAVTLSNVVITNSYSGDGTTYGGGILLGNALASLQLQNSTLSNNRASQNGGGLAVRYGSLVTIDNTIISNNSTGNFGQGGGIDMSLGISTGTTPTPTITLTNSSVINNTAGAGGGVRVGNGVAQNNQISYFTAINTTFSGNAAIGTGSGTGGAISIGNFTNVTLQNSTITGNYALLNGGGLSFAATIANTTAVNTAIINTIIAGNVNRFTPDISGAGSTTSWAIPVVNSIIGAADTSVTKLNNLGSQIGTLAAPINPQLAPLTTSGAPTFTHMPLPGSPAINAGTATPTVVLTTLSAAVTDVATTISVAAAGAMHKGLFIQIDSEIMLVNSVSGTTVTVTRGQLSTTPAAHSSGASVNRGVVVPPPANDQRGSGFPRQIGTIDIGAVEVNPAIPVATGSFAKVTAPTVGAQTITITFTDDVGMNMASIMNNNAVRIYTPTGGIIPTTFVSSTPGTGAKVETATYSFIPPGGGWDSLENGFYEVRIEPNQVNDGTNFVYAGTVNKLQVAIPRTFVVDTTDDSDDGIITPGNLSIREAIRLANESVGTVDVISFSPTVFSSPQIIQLFNGPLTITDPVNIIGPGKGLATIDGVTLGRVMFINMTPGYWGDTVSISGLTFANGTSTPSLAGAAAGITNYTSYLKLDNVDITGMFTNSSGGAIGLSTYWAGLELTNSRLFNNVAFNGAGVYVGNNGAALSTVPNAVPVFIQNTEFDQNSSQTTLTTNGGSGAGVYALGGSIVTIVDSIFSNNVVGTSGAAIFNNGANVVLDRVNILNNTASLINFGSSFGNGQGGGIFLGTTAGTTMTVRNSTIAGNIAGNTTLITGTAQGTGGGIFVSSGAVLNVESSTLSGNSGSSSVTTAGGGGGALYLTGTAKVTITNSTLSGNSAFRLGGAISINSLTNNADPNLAGFLNIRNSTIAYNSADGNGGGINFRTSSSATPNVAITSSIVAQNLSLLGIADLASGTGNATTGFTVNNSFIGIPTGAVITGANNKNTAADGSVNLNPTLALNGAPAGSPLTHAFLGASAAIDNGLNPVPQSFDQRGTGFSRVVNFKADMGAFEVQNMLALPTVVSIQVNDGMSAQRSMVQSMTITFSAPVSFPNGIGAAFSLVRTTALDGGTTGSVLVTGTQSMGNTVVTLTFLNGGAVTLDPAGSLPDGKYTLTLLSNQIAGVGGFLDGNKNGTYQGSPIDDVSTSFHRLFGDADGNGSVTAVDFAAFRLAYNTMGPSIFDYNGDDNVTATDFNAFRLRYGQSI
jgi:hypothetical protein